MGLATAAWGTASPRFVKVALTGALPCVAFCEPHAACYLGLHAWRPVDDRSRAACVVPAGMHARRCGLGPRAALAASPRRPLRVPVRLIPVLPSGGVRMCLGCCFYLTGCVLRSTLTANAGPARNRSQSCCCYLPSMRTRAAPLPSPSSCARSSPQRSALVSLGLVRLDPRNPTAQRPPLIARRWKCQRTASAALQTRCCGRPSLSTRLQSRCDRAGARASSRPTLCLPLIVWRQALVAFPSLNECVGVGSSGARDAAAARRYERVPADPLRGLSARGAPR
jgi:hypothetical protein